MYACTVNMLRSSVFTVQCNVLKYRAYPLPLYGVDEFWPHSPPCCPSRSESRTYGRRAYSRGSRRAEDVAAAYSSEYDRLGGGGGCCCGGGGYGGGGLGGLGGTGSLLSAGTIVALLAAGALAFYILYTAVTKAGRRKRRRRSSLSGGHQLMEDDEEDDVDFMGFETLVWHGRYIPLSQNPRQPPPPPPHLPLL
jgi:hypothetical protein